MEAAVAMAAAEDTALMAAAVEAVVDTAEEIAHMAAAAVAAATAAVVATAEVVEAAVAAMAENVVEACAPMIRRLSSWEVSVTTATRETSPSSSNTKDSILLRSVYSPILPASSREPRSLSSMMNLVRALPVDLMDVKWASRVDG